LGVARQVDLIGGVPVEAPLLQAAEHEARVTVGLLPQLRIEVLEKRPYGTVPAEEQIGGELRQAAETPRDLGRDFE